MHATDAMRASCSARPTDDDLRAALMRPPVQSRGAIVLHCLDGLSVRGTAALLELPVATLGGRATHGSDHRTHQLGEGVHRA